MVFDVLEILGCCPVQPAHFQSIFYGSSTAHFWVIKPPRYKLVLHEPLPSLVWKPHLLHGLSSRHLRPGFYILKAKVGFLGRLEPRGHVVIYYSLAGGLLDAEPISICGIDDSSCAGLSLQQSLGSDGIHQTTI